MLLRKDMSKFIKKHHKNDEFRMWVENTNILQMYESKFDKFNHNAGSFLSDKMEAVRKTGDKLALFAFTELAVGQVYIGEYYAEYLKNIKQKVPLSKAKLSSCKFTNEEKEWFDDFFQGLKIIYSGGFSPSFVKFEITINDYSNINTFIMKRDIQIIIIELISNTIIHNQGKGKDNHITISFENDKIIYKSKTINKLTSKKVTELNNSIKGTHLKGGIGFFIINKLINSILEKNISIAFENNEFIVTIPIN